MADVYIEYLPSIGNPQFDLAARRIVDLLRTYISSFDTNEVTGGDTHDHSGSIGFKRKIVEIGDWNMDSTASVSVAHGLTLSKIRKISVTVVRDDSAVHVPLDYNNSGNFYADATDIALTRVGSGDFDAAIYDSTSFNRGWIVIEYID